MTQPMFRNVSWPVLILLAAACTCQAAHADEATKNPAAATIALTGGRIITLDDNGTLDVGTVLVRDGKIVAVGSDVEVPDGAENIDVSGLTVFPGLIDCRSSLWMSSDSVTASASNGSLNVMDAVDLYSTAWTDVARGGVTAVSVQPTGALGGQTAVLRVAPADSIVGLVIQKDAAVQASIGLSGRTGNSRDRYAQYETLKKAFDGAKKYQEEWKTYEKAKQEAKNKKKKEDKPGKDAKSKDEAKQESKETDPAEKTDAKEPEKRPRRGGSSDRRRSGSPPSESKTSEKAAAPKDDDSSKKKAAPPKKPKHDPLKALLVRVLDGELTLRIEAHRADDVANALKLGNDFKLDIVLEGASRAGRSWKLIQSQRPPLVAGPFANFESRPAWFNGEDDRYDELADTENLLAIASYSKNSRGSRFLRFHAAQAIASGVPYDRVLKAVTINAARVLGVSDRLGSLVAGKQADLIVVAGDPLDPAAPVVLTISHGEIVHRSDPPADSQAETLTAVTGLPEQLPKQFALLSDRVLYADGTLAPGAVLVRNGRIVRVNKRRRAGKLPALDLGDAVVTPGFVVGHFTGADRDSRDASTSWVLATDALDPENTQLHELADGGFTAAAFAPDSSSVLAGNIGCVRIASNQPVDTDKNGPIVIGSKFVLSSASRSTSRFPAVLSGQLELVEQQLSGNAIRTNLYVPQSVLKLLTQHGGGTTVGMQDGTIRAVFESNTSAEINGALDLIQSHGLKGVLLHPQDLRSAVDRIADQNVGMIVHTVRASEFDWYPDDIAAASNRGIPIALSGPDPQAIRNTLAMFVAAGMQSDAALRSLSTDAADICGLKHCGRLIPGSPADIVVWNGSPLNPAARPVRVIVDGQYVKESR
jgi:imidazolonepropionase-like amidohydrolase